MTSIDILALPKGKKLKCEVCRKTAVVRCDQCHVTYYCCSEHKKADWSSLHRMICGELAVLRGPQPFPIQEEERQVIAAQLNKRKLRVKEQALAIAHDLLLKQKPELVIPAAMQALLLAIDLYGGENLEVVTPFLYLSEANLALEKEKIALEYQCQAEWILEKHDKAPVSIMAKVQKVIGKVSSKKCEWAKANEAFSEYLYYMAEEYGPDNIRLATGFCYLGFCLFNLGNTNGALASFKRMAFMWLDVFLDLYIMKDLRIPTELELQNPQTRDTEHQILEAEVILLMLDKQLDEMENSPLADYIQFVTNVALTILSIRADDEKRKLEVSQKALFIATRTKQADSISEDKVKYVIEIIGDDYLKRYELKHNRPITMATRILNSMTMAAKLNLNALSLSDKAKGFYPTMTSNVHSCDLKGTANYKLGKLPHILPRNVNCTSDCLYLQEFFQANKCINTENKTALKLHRNGFFTSVVDRE